MRRRLILAAAGAVLTSAALPQPAVAQSVDELVRRRKLVVGMLVDIPPFGDIGADGRPVGYDAEVAALMARYMGVELEIVPITGPNRMPALLTSRVDVLIATFGISPERARQVWFSIPYGALEVWLIGPRQHAVAGYADLAGVRIAVARAATQDHVLTRDAPGAQLVRYDNDAAAAQALLAGRVDMLGCNYLQAQQLIRDNPRLGLERKLVLSRQWQGITMRRGQTDLLQWTNTFLYYVKNSGELNAIHRKWFGEDLPPMPTF